MFRNGLAAGAASLLVLMGAANATPISIMVGDDDGYGAGVPDNGNTGAFATPGTDNRSGAEAAATDGAQLTDVYSSLFPGFGPNGSELGAVTFDFADTLLSATLTIDMADFQTSTFGAIAADINGESFSLAFDDGFTNSVVRSFILTPAMIAAANLAGMVVLSLDHTGSNDFIAFDYFRLDGEVDVVPLPAAIWLFGAGAIGVFGASRKKAAIRKS